MNEAPASAGRNRKRVEALWAVLLPIGLCCVALVLLWRNDLDGRLAACYYDAQAGRWPLQEAFWPKMVMHEGGRYLVFAVGAGALSTAIASLFVGRLASCRRRALFVVLAIGLSTGSVSLLKSVSCSPCPWDAVRFGGTIQHVNLFDPTPEGSAAGHCLPGAHAAGGFALMSFYYVLRERSPRRAWVALGLGFVIGNLYGWSQVARGAHFPSHNLVGALLVWTLCSLLYWVPFHGRLAPVARSHSSAA